MKAIRIARTCLSIQHAMALRQKSSISPRFFGRIIADRPDRMPEGHKPKKGRWTRRVGQESQRAATAVGLRVLSRRGLSRLSDLDRTTGTPISHERDCPGEMGACGHQEARKSPRTRNHHRPPQLTWRPTTLHPTYNQPLRGGTPGHVTAAGLFGFLPGGLRDRGSCIGRLRRCGSSRRRCRRRVG